MITIVALLTIRDLEAFDEFERQAIQIMQAHGGSLDSAFKPAAAQDETAQRVDEVHILKFPDEQSFERYQADDKLLQLATLRERAISQTSLYVSTTGTDYSSQE